VRKSNKIRNDSEYKRKMEKKRMHGQFPRSLDEKLVDKEQSHRWLKFGDIKGGTIVAAQDQAISTNCLKKIEKRN
jgi:hypothetical protein